MQRAAEIINLVHQTETKPSAENDAAIGQEGVELTDFEIDLIDYVFHKIQVTWGDLKFWKTFSDEKTLGITKLDWAGDLLKAINTKVGRDAGGDIESQVNYENRLRARVDKMFAGIRSGKVDENGTDWTWPNLTNICVFMGAYVTPRGHKEFEPRPALEDLTAKQKAKSAGAREISNMMAMFEE